MPLRALFSTSVLMVLFGVFSPAAAVLLYDNGALNTTNPVFGQQSDPFTEIVGENFVLVNPATIEMIHFTGFDTGSG